MWGQLIWMLVLEASTWQCNERASHSHPKRESLLRNHNPRTKCEEWIFQSFIDINIPYLLCARAAEPPALVSGWRMTLQSSHNPNWLSFLELVKEYIIKLLIRLSTHDTNHLPCSLGEKTLFLQNKHKYRCFLYMWLQNCEFFPKIWNKYCLSQVTALQNQLVLVPFHP